MSRGDPQVMLRLPGDLRARVKAQAQRSRRSMNAEIVLMIEAGLRSAVPQDHQEPPVNLESATDQGAEKFGNGLGDWHTDLAGIKGNAPGGESPEALDLR